MPGKKTLAPLAGLAMAVIAAACLVTFSLVASNTISPGSRGPVARPQSPPGGGDGAVVIPAPGSAAGEGSSDGSGSGEPGSDGSVTLDVALSSDGSGAVEESPPETEAVAALALADFFGGRSSDEEVAARVPAVGGRPGDHKPSINPETGVPTRPAGDGEGEDCPKAKLPKDERGSGHPHGGPPACGNPHGGPPGHTKDKAGKKPRHVEAPQGPPSDAGPSDRDDPGGSGHAAPKPKPKGKKQPPPPAAPPVGSANGDRSDGGDKPSHPHGGPPGHSKDKGDVGEGSKAGGHPHGAPPGQTKKEK